MLALNVEEGATSQIIRVASRLKIYTIRYFLKCGWNKNLIVKK